MNIRTECYLAVLKKYKQNFPEAHFEVITRTVKSILSPSKELLYRAKFIEKEYGKMGFGRYRALFLKEILNNPEALKRIEELREIAKEKVVFLVCYERDETICHRSIVKEIIERTIKL